MSHADEVATLKTALEKEKSSRKKEVDDLHARHGAEMQRLTVEHASKVISSESRIE